MERWDVYDKNGNLKGYTKTREDVWTEDEYHLGASLWMINLSGEVLIQKRAASKKRFPNVWGNIGGSVLAGESSRQGCVREVYEEVRIKVNIDDLVFLQRAVFTNTICDDYAVMLDVPIENIVFQAEEVSEVKWAGVDEIKSLFHQGLFLMDDLADLEKVIKYINKALDYL